MTDLTRTNEATAAIVERVITTGDLAKLTAADRVDYYNQVCSSLGLNPLTKPFTYIELDGKLVLYAQRDCTDQLRNLRRISIEIVSRQRIDDVYIVEARATTPDGRTDVSTGVVPLAKEGGSWQTNEKSGKRYFKSDGTSIPFTGNDLANALMKAETKAKRRVTLSIVGLGWLDETELDTIASARPVVVDTTTGEIAGKQPQSFSVVETSAGPVNPTTGELAPLPPTQQPAATRPGVMEEADLPDPTAQIFDRPPRAMPARAPLDQPEVLETSSDDNQRQDLILLILEVQEEAKKLGARLPVFNETLAKNVTLDGLQAIYARTMADLEKQKTRSEQPRSERMAVRR